MQNNLTRAKFDELLQSYIEKEKADIAEHEAIKAILTPLVGKPIDGRTLSQKKLGEFRLRTQFGMFYIVGKRSEHLIGYVGSENQIAVEKESFSRGFEYFDACSGSAAAQRIKQIEATDKDEAYKLFSEIEHHFNSLRDLFGQLEDKKLGSYHFPAYYRILDAIYKSDKTHSDIKLTDFYFIRTN